MAKMTVYRDFYFYSFAPGYSEQATFQNLYLRTRHYAA